MSPAGRFDQMKAKMIIQVSLRMNADECVCNRFAPVSADDVSMLWFIVCSVAPAGLKTINYRWFGMLLPLVTPCRAEGFSLILIKQLPLLTMNHSSGIQ